MKRRVGVNGLFLSRPNTGMGRYTLGLLRALPGAMRGTEFVVFVPEPPQGLPKLPAAVKLVVVPPGRSLLGRGKVLDEWERNRLGVAASQMQAQLIFQPYPTPPIRNPYGVPVVMTVHDMIPWQLPRYRRAIRSKVKLRGVLSGIQTANRILTVSNNTAKAITWAAKVPAERITVTYEGIESEYAKRPPATTQEAVRRQYGLKRPFVLYLGGYDYRKNIRTLLQGFAESGLAGGYDLVLAGAVTAPASALYEDYHRLPELVAQAGLGGRTHVLGFVSEVEKRALLASAGSFVFPSLAEGFGLPVLEALALKTPVAAADIPSQPELFRDAYEPFKPTDPVELGHALRTATEEADPHKVARGTDAFERYSWPNAARATAQAFKAEIGAADA